MLDESPSHPSELAELTEFLTCEASVRPADPVFRERLRAELWWGFVSRLMGRGGGRTPVA